MPEAHTFIQVWFGWRIPTEERERERECVNNGDKGPAYFPRAKEIYFRNWRCREWKPAFVYSHTLYQPNHAWIFRVHLFCRFIKCVCVCLRTHKHELYTTWIPNQNQRKRKEKREKRKRKEIVHGWMNTSAHTYQTRLHVLWLLSALRTPNT